jgi:hypothetical protein
MYLPKSVWQPKSAAAKRNLAGTKIIVALHHTDLIMRELDELW